MRKLTAATNAYKTRGEVTIVFLRRRDGAVMETVIDTKDLPLVMSIPVSWHAAWDKVGRRHYVHGRMYEQGKQRTICLHRVILGAPEGLLVDHRNGDGLDNRRGNLRLATPSENQQNRTRAPVANKSSGIRGVSWHKWNRKWIAYLTVDRKRLTLGRFETLESAAAAVAAARLRMMPFSEERVSAD